MKRNNTLSHTVWDCKYHIVWIPKFRRKVLYYKLRTYLGKIFQENHNILCLTRNLLNFMRETKSAKVTRASCR